MWHRLVKNTRWRKRILEGYGVIRKPICVQHAVTDQILIAPQIHAQNTIEDDTPEASTRVFRMGKPEPTAKG
jgi:hypothetical protein